MNEITAINTSANALQINSFNQALFFKWIQYLDAKPKTIETYNKNIKHFMKYLNDNGIKTPTRQDILNYRDFLKATHKPTTTQGYLIAVKLFFQWCETEKIFPNIANHIKGVKLEAGFKKEYLRPQQAVKVLKSIDRETLQGKRDFALISLLMTAGLRTIEAQRANIGDLRNAGDTLALFIQGKGKEEKDAYVKIPQEVEKAINEYLQARGETRTTEALFCSISNRNTGKRLTTESISRIVKNVFRGAGFDSELLTAHSLRHTTATLNLLNGGTLEETSQLLRHKSLNTTLIYSHALERAKNNSEQRVSTAIFSLM